MPVAIWRPRTAVPARDRRCLLIHMVSPRRTASAPVRAHRRVLALATDIRVAGRVRTRPFRALQIQDCLVHRCTAPRRAGWGIGGAHGGPDQDTPYELVILLYVILRLHTRTWVPVPRGLVCPYVACLQPGPLAEPHFRSQPWRPACASCGPHRRRWSRSMP